MMEKLFRGAKAPLLVIILCALVLIAAVVGGLVVIFGKALSFQEYLSTLWKFALAVSILGFGTSVADAYAGKVSNGINGSKSETIEEKPKPQPAHTAHTASRHKPPSTK